MGGIADSSSDLCEVVVTQKACLLHNNVIIVLYVGHCTAVTIEKFIIIIL